MSSWPPAGTIPAWCWATPPASGAVAAVVRRLGDLAVAFLKLVVVDPEAQRAGRGASLLRAAEEWAWDEGAGELHLAGSAPFYLWPGVDVSFTAAAQPGRVGRLRRDRGGVRHDGARGLPAPGARRGRAAAGPRRRRRGRGGRVWWPAGGPSGRPSSAAAPSRARAWVPSIPTPARPWRSPATRSTGPAGSVRRARPTTGATGASAWPCSARCARDLSVAGYTEVEICWIGPVGFYAAAGGRFSRVFRTYRRVKTVRGPGGVAQAPLRCRSRRGR